MFFLSYVISYPINPVCCTNLPLKNKQNLAYPSLHDMQWLLFIQSRVSASYVSYKAFGDLLLTCPSQPLCPSLLTHNLHLHHVEPLSRHARALHSRDFSRAFLSVQCPSSESFPRKFVFILYDSEDKIENVGRMIMLDGWDRWGLSWWILENLDDDWPLLTCPISFYFSVHCISTSLCSYSS